MLLPGPEAQQLAIYIVGWMHRTGVESIAGLLFILPSLFLLILLSWIYMRFGHVPEIAGVLYGIKPPSPLSCCSAAHRIGSRALKNGVLWTLACAGLFRNLRHACTVSIDCVARSLTRRDWWPHVPKNLLSAADMVRPDTASVQL